MEDVKTSPGEDLFSSELECGTRMHINALSGSPQVDKAVRPLESPGYVELRQPGLELPRSQ